MDTNIQEFGALPVENRFYWDGLAFALREHGLIVIRGTTAAAYLTFFDSIAKRMAHRDSNESLVTEIAPTHDSGGEGNDGLTRKGLPLHTDGSGSAEPPTIIGMFCVTQASSGGETLIADGQQVVADLQQNNPSALLTLACEPVRFGLDAPYIGRVLEPSASDDCWSIRFRDDGLADFGNAGPSLDILRRTMEARTISFTLAPNDAYFLQNGRWLHGRTSFEGERKIMRVSGRPLSSCINPVPHGFPWCGLEGVTTTADDALLKTA